ncbi:MAG: DUF600 family protein [Spirochaetales bacterium]|nr:DUF600 family protein [Leptospiraceae bacterium]MCP5480622.1 DUF600 family protein [Spirochaetales bacterium]MCP5483974.1 DUF600 family protein [Spirochaetales bacterium]
MHEREQFEDLLHVIGSGALAHAPGLGGPLLLYAEAEQGTVAASIFYVERGKSSLSYRFCPLETADHILDLWEAHRRAEPESWWSMTMVINEGRFQLDFQYADRFDTEKPPLERRTSAVQKCFGDMGIDYSNPG